MDIFATISPEEWELLRPAPQIRAANIMEKIRTKLRTEGQCGNCTAWQMKSAELVDLNQGAAMIDVGGWEPMQGLMLKDDLFPHVTGGLRGRVFKVASINVI
jgi:ionotropic glutamate receptor